MGGPQIRTSEEAVLAERLATTGLDPKKVGERVVDAIRTKTFYAFVSAVPADVIKARHRRIEGPEHSLGDALLTAARGLKQPCQTLPKLTSLRPKAGTCARSPA
jgi:hypothetical protein